TTTRTYSALDSLQLADEGLERGLDVASERHEQDDDDGGDEGEDDAVLGHCLAFLALDVVLHPLEQERCEHVIHLDVRGLCLRPKLRDDLIEQVDGRRAE